MALDKLSQIGATFRSWTLVSTHPQSAAVYVGTTLSPRTNIYRYMAWEWARELFETGELRLASPREWNDPYERWWCDVLFRKGSKLESANAFACCWSTRSGDEPYWRLYDHGGKRPVVRLRTTVSKVLDALSVAVTVSPAKAFIGRVRYRPTVELVRVARDIRRGTKKEIAAVAAKMLHMKRIAFRFEKEVRIVWVDRADGPVDRRIKVDISTMFDQVTVGPSVSPAQADSIGRHLHSHRVSPSIVKRSLLYRKPRAV